MTTTSTAPADHPAGSFSAHRAGRGARLASLAVTGALLLTGTTGVVAATAEQLLRLH